MNSYHIWALDRLRDNLDGPGIRTLILLSGCPLRCAYCLNQQSWEPGAWDRFVTAKELYDEVARDLIYFSGTGGGVTFGGGEPLLQPGLICEFAEETAGRFSIMAETSLHVPPENVRMAASAADCFIVDIKTADPVLYHRYTGGNLEPVLSNLKELLAAVGKDRILVRIPLIPGFTDEESCRHSEETLRKLGIVQFDRFRYRIPRKIKETMVKAESAQ